MDRQIETGVLHKDDSVLIFFMQEDDELYLVEKYSLNDTVDFINYLFKTDTINIQRVIDANKESYLYRTPYVSNIISRHDKTQHYIYRVVCVYKSIWNKYSKVQKKNRLRKLGYEGEIK